MQRDVRNCDLIADMPYLKTCYMCSGNGEYEQTYTVGCGGGYYQMKGRCDSCCGTGIKTINGGKVSASHLAQIGTYRAQAALKTKEPSHADR